MIESIIGIVLRKKPSGESDAIVHVLAESGELRRVKLHGIRQSKKRSNLLAEPGCQVDLRIHSTREIASVKEGKVLQRFDRWKEGYLPVSLLSCLLELVDASAAASSDLYPLIHDSMMQGERNSEIFSKKGALLFWILFRLKILSITGFIGDPAHCAECGSDLKECAKWLVPEMSFLCEKCAPEASKEHAQFAHQINFALGHGFSECLTANIFASDGVKFDQLLTICLKTVLPHPSPASEEFSQTIR